MGATTVDQPDLAGNGAGQSEAKKANASAMACACPMLGGGIWLSALFLLQRRAGMAGLEELAWYCINQSGATTVFRIAPTHSTSTSTTSPGFR